MRKFFALALVAVSASVASAAPVSLFLTQSVPAVPANRVVNNLAVNSTSDVQGLQMIVNLTAGTIFQSGSGGNTAPSFDAVNGNVEEGTPANPALEWDTFVTMGGFLSTGPNPSSPVLVVGGAVNIQSGAALKFDTAGLNVTWAPGTGVFTGPVTNFPVARVTLSNTATGTAQFFLTSAGEVPTAITTLPIVNGVIVPEPASAVMGLLALCGLGVARRR
jgi:hypothetical protein